jgi:hypothetical protein
MGTGAATLRMSTVIVACPAQTLTRLYVRSSCHVTRQRKPLARIWRSSGLVYVHKVGDHPMSPSSEFTIGKFSFRPVGRTSSLAIVVAVVGGMARFRMLSHLLLRPFIAVGQNR